jgi:serine/threonine protein kinase
MNGLEYLHKHDIVHGDLKGVSPWFSIELIPILINATRQISSWILTAALALRISDLPWSLMNQPRVHP